MANKHSLFFFSIHMKSARFYSPVWTEMSFMELVFHFRGGKKTSLFSTLLRGREWFSHMWTDRGMWRRTAGGNKVVFITRHLYDRLIWGVVYHRVLFLKPLKPPPACWRLRLSQPLRARVALSERRVASCLALALLFQAVLLWRWSILPLRWSGEARRKGEGRVGGGGGVWGGRLWGTTA